MPQRAFVPAPLTEAQPRVYKSFRGRQLSGILFGAAGATLSVLTVGVSDILGYAATFLAALPGFAYGYYQLQGKPVEYWIGVLVRYYTKPQHISFQQRLPIVQTVRNRVSEVVRAAVCVLAWHIGRGRG